MKEPSTIELKPEQTAIVLDENGELVEFYLPNVPDTSVVPDKIVRIIKILLEDGLNEVD